MKELILFVLGIIAYIIASIGMDKAHVRLWSCEFWMIFLGILLGSSLIGRSL